MPGSEWDLLHVVRIGAWLVGLMQALFLLAWTYHSTRYFRKRVAASTPRDYTPRVQLFLPCKGVEASFAATVHGILELDYPSYSVSFIVESRDDPAYSRLRELLAGPRRVPARVLVAHVAQDCGQKVHNLVTATAHLEEGTEVLAFLDSDAVPERDWLRHLVAPLQRERTGVVTGYRWFLAERGDWPGTVLSALNAVVAFAPGNHHWNQVWGGSWAIRRSTFERLRQDGVWRGAVTEDLPVSHGVRRLGQRVVYEPNCLVASPVRGSWRGLVEFARRQYLIARVYAPGLWSAALVSTALAQSLFWGALALALWGGTHGQSVAAPVALAGAVFALNALRAGLRQRAAARRFPGRRAGLDCAAALDLLAQPLLGLMHLGLLLASAGGRTITWRSIRYRLHGPHRTEVLHHPGAGAQAARKSAA